MANLYPNVSIALDMHAKVSGSFKNAKSWFYKDFYAKISDFFKKPKKEQLWQGFLGWFFVCFMGQVFCANLAQ